MSRSIQQLLSDGKDFDVCDGVFERIVDYYGDDIDVSSLSAEYRAVFLVYQSTGMIGNGGFNYLFEGSFNGDPAFSLTAEAFRTIGCLPATEAFEKALDLFPGSMPPADIGRRLKIYRRGTGDIRHEIDRHFWHAKSDLWKHLAAFIRTHGERFQSLDDANPKSQERHKPAPKQEPTGPAPELGTLPHWARVAFAARCARHVLQIFDVNWPDASESRRDAVTTAIELAEESAANACPNNGLKDAVLNATITAGSALRSLHGRPLEDGELGPPNGNMAVVASYAVKVAEKAGMAAQTTPDRSETFALEAFSLAQKAAADNHELVDRMYTEVDKLSAVAARGKWTHDTAVPTGVFESLATHDGNIEKPWWKFW